MEKDSNILVTGGRGLVGGAIVNHLKSEGYRNVFHPTSESVNLQSSMGAAWIVECEPEYIFHAAAMVGGIRKNIDMPADFGMVNSLINNNVIRAAHVVKAKLLFLGSSCIYPKECKQPMKEEYLLSGPCEPTNEMYALSKIYGIKMCQAYRKQYDCNFITGQPCNIYGVGDCFDLDNAHVVGALIHRFHNAKCEGKYSVTLWGTGNARRELMYVTDAAEACVHLMKTYNDYGMINIGTGEDISIKDLAELIKMVVGFEGDVFWDTSKPDGMLRKVVDVTKIHNMGWQHKVQLLDGLKKTYDWYLENVT